MSDFKMVYSGEFGALDMVIENDDLGFDGGLETSVLISLMADRRAADEDVLVDENDRRGWWADTFADNEGDQIGSRLWLLERGLLTPQYEAQAEEYIRESLQWMIDDGIAESVTATVTTDDRAQSATTVINITRPTGDTVEFRYTGLWKVTLAV